MDKITDYKIVSEGSPDFLESSVKKLLEEGWQPFGDPFILMLVSGGALCQAMVIYKRTSGGPQT